MTAAPAPSERRCRIVIVGSGLEGWLTAATLGRALPAARYCVTLLCDPDAPPDSGDSTYPWTGSPHPASEFDESLAVEEAGAAFSLGVAMDGWATPGAAYFHPFGSIGAPLGPLPFHHVAMRLREVGADLRLGNFTLATLAAQAGRFARPDGDPRSVLSTCRHGIHLDCEAAGGLFERQARTAGVRVKEDGPGRIERAGDGSIRALVTRGGARLEGELFIDCTGSAASLIGTFAEAEWEDWSSWLPCNAVLSASVASPEPPLPYSHAQAHAAGWTRRLPLQGRALLWHYYRSDRMDQEEAERLLSARAGAELRQLETGALRPGRRRLAWCRNCVALGTSAAWIEPLAITNLQLLRYGIDRLLGLLPRGPDARMAAAEFNRLAAALLDHARDFASLHYTLNGRHGEPFWDACREIAPSEPASYKLRVYRGRGRLVMFDEEPIEEAGWISLLDEHGIRPRWYHPMAGGFDPAMLGDHARKVRELMLDAVRRMPAHGEYLSRLASKNRGSGEQQ